MKKYIPYFLICSLGSIVILFMNIAVIASTTNDLVLKICSLFAIIALSGGVYYTSSGFKKEGAVYYKTFMGLFAVSSVIDLIALILNSPEQLLFIVLKVFIIAVIAILAFSKDLGREKSETLAKVMVGAEVIAFIYLFATHPGTFRGGDMESTIHALETLNQVALAIMACLMVHAKYIDKASRGTN